MTHLELFAGIGGFRRATELLDKDGIMPFKSVGFSEIDKHALLTYKTVYNISNNEVELGDIVEFTKNKENIENLPDFDLLTGGFPCQCFSAMGKQQGFNDDLGRGQMFFRIMDILEVKHPPYVLLENVRNLLSHDNGNTFKVIKEQLESIGYAVHYDVFNTMDFHLPQHRRRVLIFATLDKTPFDFNSKTIQEWFDKIYTTTSLEHGETVLEFLDKDAEQKYFLSEKGRRYILSDGTKSFTNLKNTINTPIAKTLLTGCGAQKKAFSANYYTQEWIETNGLANAQEAMPFEELVKQPIRRLTPEEAYLLQGFPRDFALAARNVGISNTALYKQAGNAISVNVIYAVLRWLIENKHIQ